MCCGRSGAWAGDSPVFRVREGTPPITPEMVESVRFRPPVSLFAGPRNRSTLERVETVVRGQARGLITAYLRPDLPLIVRRTRPFDDGTILRRRKDMGIPLPLPSPSPAALYRGGIDLEELASAWRLLRGVALRLDRIAKQHGWPTPFTPSRYLILALLEHATGYGLSPRRLARALALNPSTVAHHLDVLERAGLVQRAPWTIYDRRKVAVRLTATGHHAAQCFTGAAAA